MKRLFFALAALLSLWPRVSAEVVADEGAWCWFADPRALHHSTPDGRINMTYIGYIDTHGNIKAAQYDFNKLNKTDVLVRSYFQPDDHDNPTFLVLPDQRVMVFYSRHTDEPCFYYRISQEPGNITSLGPEQVIETANNTTYPSPFILADDPDHIYLCWRGINWHPTIAKLSLPDANGKVEVVDGPYQIVQSTGARPYAKYSSNGKDRIELTYTTGHPDNENPNFLYYNYIDINSGNLCDVKGNVLSHVADGPYNVNKSDDFVKAHPDMVVDASAYRDWVWQLAKDKKGNPLIAMTRISDDKKSHNYYLARWDGKEWTKQFIAHAGGHFHQTPETEHCYSAGFAIDTNNPDVLYCALPQYGQYGKKYEIMKYSLDSNGEVTAVEAITTNSEKNNSRPYFIGGDKDTPLKLAWMNGDYYDWIVSSQRPLGYCTSIETDFDGFGMPIFGALNDVNTPASSLPAKFDPSSDFVYEAEIDTDQLGTKCEIVSTGKLIYAMDPATLFPEIRYANKVYRSSNKLATADSWTEKPRSTDGKWYDPVPLKKFNLKLQYADGVLKSYINGVLDQSVRLAPAMTTASVFQPKGLDYKLSPYTGMTRRNWIEAAEYLLSGAFGYINSTADPMFFPKQLDKTYPRNDKAIKVAKLEGLARTLFIAAPLLKENPGLTLNGIKVADYYHDQIIGLINPESPNYEPLRKGGPSQTLLELGSIAMSLQIAKEELWDTFTQTEKDGLAALFKSYGEGPSIPSNWRFFNVFLMSFLKEQGYDVNEAYLKENLEGLLDMYRGEGWYNDAPAYDYYSMWAYQTYGPLWAHYFGNKQFPEIAAKFTAYQADMLDNYPYMFAADGRMNMWGRSIPYRFACVAPFAMVEWGGHDNANYGWLRQISSASLLQFMQHPDFMQDGVPTMGFLGAFAPTVQIYSCRGSVYWMGKAFFNLLLPEESPYWTATENAGPWEKDLKKGQVYNKFQPATNLMITNYPNCGGSEMRSWCHETVAADWQKFRSSENYNKLAYHTEFPWMADGSNGEVSMNYATLNRAGRWEVLRLYDFDSFADGMYRRKATLETEPGVTYQLVDIPLPDGVLRIDKVSVSSPTEIRLGSYSLPETNSSLVAKTAGDAHLLSNDDYQVAVVPLHGWDKTFEAYPMGLHPVSDRCGVIMNSANVDGERVFVTLQLWGKGKKGISSKLINQVNKVEVSENNKTVNVTFADGTNKTINFE